MPSRILKESICTSESLAYLSAEAEVLFYRLIVKADDFGLYYGSPKILASLLFPLNVPTEKKVSSWLAELVNGGLVATYRGEDGRQYLKLLSWDNTRTGAQQNPSTHYRKNLITLAVKRYQVIILTLARKCKQILP